MAVDQCYQTNTKSIKIQAGSVNYPNMIDELILKLTTDKTPNIFEQRWED